VLDAIDRGDLDALCEELGDLLLQIVFYAQIAREEGRFTIEDVMDRITKKIIHRHPHVFGDEKVSCAGDVLKNWEELKKKEGKKSTLGGVPPNIPALLKAFRLGEKTSRVGFDWENADGILSKIEEEAHELHEARKGGKKDEIDHEFGDLLFTLANLGRFLEIDPEGSLRRATYRFMDRFNWMEEKIAARGQRMKDLSPAEWDELWNEAKRHHEDKGRR
jgi:MazG family protein